MPATLYKILYTQTLPHQLENDYKPNELTPQYNRSGNPYKPLALLRISFYEAVEDQTQNVWQWSANLQPDFQTGQENLLVIHRDDKAWQTDSENAH